MPLMVNDTRIGFLYAQRLKPAGNLTSDTICTYKWEIEITGKGMSFKRGTIDHRFGDGAWALVSKIINESGITESEMVVK